MERKISIQTYITATAAALTEASQYAQIDGFGTRIIVASLC